MTIDVTDEVAALYDGLQRIYNMMDGQGRRVGSCKNGIYLFYDYDGEPIYVGQSRESLRQRIGRHMTNRRTDAVAMNVLDPFEVAEIEMWPFWDLGDNVGDVLNRAEYTVYQNAISQSVFKMILNEGAIPEADLIELPKSYRGTVLSDEMRHLREHPDIRLARRARTIADLARVISERKVKVGIRRTLWAQAQRLEWLAKTRLEELYGSQDIEE